MPRFAPADMAEEELAQALSTLTRPRRTGHDRHGIPSARIEAEQKRREMLLDRRMERMDSWPDSLE